MGFEWRERGGCWERMIMQKKENKGQIAKLHNIFHQNTFSLFSHNIIDLEMGSQITRVSEDSLKIHFKVKKMVEFGKAVYVVGNIQQLGNWNVDSSLKLCWNEGHYWTGLVQVPSSTLSHSIQFKYVVGNWENASLDQLEWEAGVANRKIQIPRAQEHVICENSWNMDRMTLNLIVPKSSYFSEFSILGNCRELGSWKKPVKLEEVEMPEDMRQEIRGRGECEENLKMFSTSLQIYRGKINIHYYYVRKQRDFVIERHPGRKYEFAYDQSVHPRCLKITHESGDTEIYETCDFKELNYSRVNKDILLGAYLRSREDCKILKKEGVTSILSIQTDQDLASHHITSDYLTEICQQENLTIYTCSIEDMNKEDFLEKWAEAVKILRNLISSGQTVYVHCSAGVYRSPQIVALYLMLANKLTSQQAVEFVKEKHPFARPSLKLVANAYELAAKKANRLFRSHCRISI